MTRQQIYEKAAAIAQKCNPEDRDVLETLLAMSKNDRLRYTNQLNANKRWHKQEI